MAIEKNSYKVSRFDLELSPQRKDTSTMPSSEDEEFQRRNTSAVESDEDDEDDFEDCDSGAGSDDFDLLELGESGEEFCQFGDQRCSIPFELYDLSGLHEVLSVDVWNEVLSEEERFTLAKYLPDLDQETCMRTIKELLTGVNLNFGSPLDKLFDTLKGGLCEPRVALYRQGLMFFQRRQHYHLLHKYHNTMVSNICQIKDAWTNCKGYSIDEKLRVLNIMKSQKSLMNEKMEDLKSDSSEKEAGEGFWGKKVKDLKVGKKLVAHSGGGISSPVDVISQAREMRFPPAKPGRQNQKGPLKSGGSKTATTKELEGSFPSLHQGMGVKSVPYGLTLPRAQQNKMSAYDSASASRMRDQLIVEDDDDESMYEVCVKREQKFSRVAPFDQQAIYKKGRKHEALSGEEYLDSFLRLPRNEMYANGRNKPVNQLSDIKVLTSEPSNVRGSYEFNRKFKNKSSTQTVGLEDQRKHGKGKTSKFSLKSTHMEILDANESYWPSKSQVEPFAAVSKQSYERGDWNTRGTKWNMGRNSPDLRVNAQVFGAEHRWMPSQESLRVNSVKGRGRDAAKLKGAKIVEEVDETESDSSEHFDEPEDDNPVMRRKWAFPGNTVMKKPKLAKKYAKVGMWAVDESPETSRQFPDFSEYQRNANLIRRADQKGMMHKTGQVNSAVRDFNGNGFFGPGGMQVEHDRPELFRLGRKNIHNEEDLGERLHIPMFKGHSVKKGKGEAGYEHRLPKANLLELHDLEEEDDSLPLQSWARDAKVSNKLGKKSSQARTDAQLVGCNSLSKKRKLKDEIMYSDEGDLNEYLLSVNNLQMDVADSSKKRGKKMFDHESDNLGKAISGAVTTDMEVDAVEIDIKPQKKPFVLITPTNHTDFSFSIIHLLSSVRMSMITLLPEDPLELNKHVDKKEGTEAVDGQDVKEDVANDKLPQADVDANKSASSSQSNVPSLTVQELVNRVKSKPYDPCILETQEPLLDLVRGVLKIFSSRTAPGGAKGWKPLVVYEKSSKSWSWIGPVNCNQTDNESVEELLSPDGWGLPHKMLVKLVDSFASWLKNAQEILQQIGSLPAPPLTLMQCSSDEKERFKDLRAQKSLTTISPSCEEVRTYFRKEEVLRYSIPDRAFSYTAIDGKKSIVAPLRRCGGKPTSKARDHFMLKRDRPPHVTILCLVRDAAARLPGSIGTRADVCTLIRDSQYIVEDVSDAQVNQVVSGALDRLHYERDPCVQFDGERKLWVYLHRDREEEDFEDDGTSSTKKWKRPRKEVTDPVEPGSVSVPLHASGEQAGSDLNLEPSCTDRDKETEQVYQDVRDDVEDNVENSQGTEQGAGHDASSSMVWDAFAMHPMQETRLLCHENSTHVDFEDHIFSGEPPT